MELEGLYVTLHYNALKLYGFVSIHELVLNCCDHYRLDMLTRRENVFCNVIRMR